MIGCRCRFPLKGFERRSFFNLVGVCFGVLESFFSFVFKVLVVFMSSVLRVLVCFGVFFLVGVWVSVFVGKPPKR